MTADSEPLPIVIVGAGETAELAWEYFSRDSPHEVAAFSVERGVEAPAELAGLPVVPLDELAERHPPGDHLAFVAISSTHLNRLRARLFAEVRELGYGCASYVSSHAFVWPSVRIGENCFVLENNVLQHGVEIRDDVVLWSGNHVGHRSVIGEHAFISSHVVISGYCRVGESTFMGVNACVHDGVVIAPDTVVAAGAVVTKKTRPRSVVAGNPARPTGADALVTFGVDEPA